MAAVRLSRQGPSGESGLPAIGLRQLPRHWRGRRTIRARRLRLLRPGLPGRAELWRRPGGAETSSRGAIRRDAKSWQSSYGANDAVRPRSPAACSAGSYLWRSRGSRHTRCGIDCIGTWLSPTRSAGERNSFSLLGADSYFLHPWNRFRRAKQPVRGRSRAGRGRQVPRRRPCAPPVGPSSPSLRRDRYLCRKDSHPESARSSSCASRSRR